MRSRPSLDFSNPDGLRWSMEGAGVLYNTYWIRLARGGTTFEQAVGNSKLLFDAAADAGVERVVHFSVANASLESRLPYFRGKGRVEEILKSSDLSYAIIRPTLVFGKGDLLLNNMAWALRRFPVFPSLGPAITPSSPFMPRTWRARRWMPVPGMIVLSPTPPGRTRSLSRNG